MSDFSDYIKQMGRVNKPFAEEGDIVTVNGKTQYGKLTIVELSGTWFEMGCQYGNHLKEKLLHVYNEIYSQKLLLSRQQCLSNADYVYNCASENVKSFLNGVSHSAGIELQTLKLINTIEVNAFISGCSFLSVTPPFISDGVLIGRSYEYSSNFACLDNDVVMTVFRPTNGIQFLTVGYVGEIYCVNGFNENGVFIELNNGTPSGGCDSDLSKVFGPNQLFNIISSVKNVENAVNYLQNNQPELSYLIGVSDCNHSICVEWDKIGSQISADTSKSGTIAFTNYYLNPNWKFPQPDDNHCWHGITRRNNLVSKANEYRGRFDTDTMCQVMSKNIQDGGVVIPNMTVYQIVFDFSTGNLWINIRDLKTSSNKWHEINLKTFFK